PIRHDFYASGNPTLAADVLKNSTDDLSSSTVDPYQIAERFTYYPRWTNEHFSVQRELIRAMCLDSAEELKGAWKKHHDASKLRGLPTVELKSKDSEIKAGDGTVKVIPGKIQTVELNWRNAPDMSKQFNTLDYTREWTTWYRNHYENADPN
ncbi:MAG TPA: hypothetical protein PK402_10605, partial [Tepidisphaeraceae bacterium]|nr:hypothetical protein [Tepidisphaeraceae bacterium]